MIFLNKVTKDFMCHIKQIIMHTNVFFSYLHVVNCNKCVK